MVPPWWVRGIWAVTGLALSWVLGALSTWVGLSQGPLAGGLTVVLLIWGALSWAAGRPGRTLGAVLQAAASGGAAAALPFIWFFPLLAAWQGGPAAALTTLGAGLILAALAGVALGRSLSALAADPRLHLPDASALAEVIGGPGPPGFFGLLGLAAAARWGTAAGWWPGVAGAIAVVPGLVGLGMLLGRTRTAQLTAGSVAVGLVLLPAVVSFGTAGPAAPGLSAPGWGGLVAFQSTYGPLIGLGACAGGAALHLVTGVWRALLKWRAEGAPRRPVDGRAVACGLLAAALGAGAWWAAWGFFPAAGLGLALALVAGTLVAAGVAGWVAAQLGSLGWAFAGLPVAAAAALVFSLRLAGPGASSAAGPEPILTGAALALTGAFFAVDYLQARRVNLLLGEGPPSFWLKVVSGLAGLFGAAVAALTVAARPELVNHFYPPAAAGPISRAALAGTTGSLPGGLALSGAALAGVVWLLGRFLWPVAFGAFLPLPAALTLLLGGLAAPSATARARTAGLALVVGDLAAQGLAVFLRGWGLASPRTTRWDLVEVLPASWRLSLLGLATVAAVLLAAAAAAGTLPLPPRGDEACRKPVLPG